jgi:hypothetical protein
MKQDEIMHAEDRLAKHPLHAGQFCVSQFDTDFINAEVFITVRRW